MSSHCIICGSTKYAIIGKPRITKTFPRAEQNNYHIAQCEICGFYFVDPSIDLSESEWKTLYEENYFGEAMKTDWQIKLNQKENSERIQWICNVLGEKQGNFLDMGCGEGYMIRHALVNGFTPYACDIANNLQTDLSATIPCFIGNLMDAAYVDQQFSVIHCDSVLEHVPDPSAIMQEFYRILKPGGVVLFIVPNEDSLMNTLTKWTYFLTGNRSKYGKIKPFVTPYHINGFNRNSIKNLVKRHGFQLVKLTTFGGNYAFWKASKAFSRSWLINLLLYPAGLLSVLLGNQIQLLAILRKPQ